MEDVSVKDLAEYDVLVHMAAHGVTTGMDDWMSCFNVNVSKSLALWQRCLQAGIKNLIICGSCFEYGKSAERYDYIPIDAPLVPTGAYHASKAAASMAAIGLAHQHPCRVTIIRPFHVFGDGEPAARLWPSLKKAALAGMDYPMTLGEQIRDFTEVSTMAGMINEVVEDSPNRPLGYSITNLGSGRPQTVREFAERAWKELNARGRLLVGAVPYRPNEVMRYVPSVK